MSRALPSLLDPATPEIVRVEMQALRDALDARIPQKRDTARNLLIATWNLKAFASLTDKWTATGHDSPKRDWRALWAITEIVSRFDVIALQEVKGDLKALRTMLKTLGPHWQFLMTDVTHGKAGNSERLAFLFDARRVMLSGLACELVVPDEVLGVGEGAMQRQFARTPYAVGFRSGAETFVLVSLHVDYGSKPEDRYPELKAIAAWMDDWSRRMTEWEQNFLALGDFNIDRHGSLLWQAFASTGLYVPQDLETVPRSIFATQACNLDKFYDQIAWFQHGGKRQLNMRYRSGGSFDFVPFLYTETGMERAQLQHRVSDHYPLWAEFDCRS